MGCSPIFAFIVICLSVTTTTLLLVHTDQYPIIGVLAVIWTEAVLSFTCLFGILFGDMGIVRRTPKTCLPPHPEVLKKIVAGEAFEDSVLQANATEPVAPFRSYCARCYVYRSSPRSIAIARGDSPEALERAANDPQDLWEWRQRGKQQCFLCGFVFGRRKPAHHCSTCQRCVEDFDHHCGVFGRCIAGKGFGGNMGYFKGIIMLGYFGPLTCAIAVMSALVQRYGAVGVGVFFGIVASVSLLAACFSCVMMILHFARQRRRMRLAQHEEVRLEAR